MTHYDNFMAAMRDEKNKDEEDEDEEDEDNTTTSDKKNNTTTSGLSDAKRNALSAFFASSDTKGVSSLPSEFPIDIKILLEMSEHYRGK